jgi:hypothetical protein
MTYNIRRWGDDDRHLGPFTYSYSKQYRPFAVVLSSAEEEYPGCHIRVSALGHTLISELPAIIKPYREKVVAHSWDAATIERLGRDWYWNIDQREFGFSLSEGFLQIHRGRHTMDSSTDRTWGYFLPWKQWRHVRHSFYGLQGEQIATQPDTGKSYLGDPDRWRREQETADATPTVSFEFDDYDGERIVATTRIEEREWRWGTGWFKWLSTFRKSRIGRSLDIRFSAETGDRKGSWKGGTVGHSIEMEPGELHEAAFRRYCVKHNMTFVRAASVKPEE